MKDQRLALYRKIEVARKQLPDMDETAFRELMNNEFGKTSRKDMSIRELRRLVAVFSNLGVRFEARKKAKRPPDSRSKDFIEITDNMPCASQKRQILAIWRKLGYRLSSLDTRVQRAFGCHCFVWLKNPDQVSTLLADLQRREKAQEQKLRQQSCPAI